VSRVLDTARSAADSEGGYELADRAAAGIAADVLFAAETNQNLKSFFTGLTIKFVKRHRMVIVNDFAHD
jgi:hypothetical protein